LAIIHPTKVGFLKSASPFITPKTVIMEITNTNNYVAIKVSLPGSVKL